MQAGSHVDNDGCLMMSSPHPAHSSTSTRGPPIKGLGSHYSSESLRIARVLHRHRRHRTDDGARQTANGMMRLWRLSLWGEEAVLVTSGRILGFLVT